MIRKLFTGAAVLLVLLLSGHVVAQYDYLIPDEPRPDAEKVVLIHGLGRSTVAMWLLHHRLAYAGYDVVPVGYRSLGPTPDEILDNVTRQIDICCADSAQTVHFVGHSLGGLMIRAYLQESRPPKLGQVVLIGSPNKGTAFVDVYRDQWWMQLAGPMAQALGTGEGGFIDRLSAPDYSVGVIAGIKNTGPTSELIPGDDDGLVSVESTKLEGMKDFITVQTSHSMMRYDTDVAEQAIHFLQHGHFNHAQMVQNP